MSQGPASSALGFSCGSRSGLSEAVILFLTGAAPLSLLVMCSWFLLIVQPMIHRAGHSSTLLLGRPCSLNHLQPSTSISTSCGFGESCRSCTCSSVPCCAPRPPPTPPPVTARGQGLQLQNSHRSVFLRSTLVTCKDSKMEIRIQRFLEHYFRVRRKASDPWGSPQLRWALQSGPKFRSQVLAFIPSADRN